MNTSHTYQQNTINDRISKSEMIDGRDYCIENETDFDVMSSDEFEINLINRFDNDGKIITIEVHGKNTSEIISSIKNL